MTTQTLDAKLDFYKAFNKCQGTLAPATTDSLNPHFGNKYASLSAVMEAIQPFFEAGFSVLQGGIDIGGKPYLRTRLVYAPSGHEEIFEYPLISDINPQHLASATTYARRYSICALFGLCVEDDDGNVATFGKEAKSAMPSKGAAPLPNDISAPGKPIIEIDRFIPADVSTRVVASSGKTAWDIKRKDGVSYSTLDQTQGQLAIHAAEKGKEVAMAFVRNGKFLNVKKLALNDADPEVRDVAF